MSQEAYYAFWGAIIGAIAAILGGIIGGIVTSRLSYKYELRRAADNERKQWIKTVLEWATNGRRERFSHIDLQGAQLRSVILRRVGESDKGADLSYCNLSSAFLTGANLIGVNLHGADLSNADLISADLREADLKVAILRKAILHGADLRKTDLRGADMRGTDLSNVRHDAQTKWPGGFKVPKNAIKMEESERRD